MRIEARSVKQITMILCGACLKYKIIRNNVQNIFKNKNKILNHKKIKNKNLKKKKLHRNEKLKTGKELMQFETINLWRRGRLPHKFYKQIYNNTPKYVERLIFVKGLMIYIYIYIGNSEQKQ